MARIAGVDLPKNKRVEIGLTYIYGIGRSASRKILQAAGVDFDTKTDHLREDEVTAIRQIIDSHHKVEGGASHWNLDGHQATDGIGMLSRSQAPEITPCSRATNEHER